MNNNILLLLLLVSLFGSCFGVDCITSLLDLERSILSNDINIQRLTEAFFPANQYPALVVEVNYRVNNQSDLDSYSNDDFTSSFVFRWVSSPALLFIDPKILEGLSLRSLVVDYHYADISLNSFCYMDDDDDMLHNLGLLNNITIWLKSYALKRRSSIMEGLDKQVRGYAAYKRNNNHDNFFVFLREREYESYVFFMGIAMFALILFCTIAAPVEIDSYYVALHEKSEKNRKSHQRFRFKSIYWAFITIFGWVIVVIAGVDLYHLIEFGYTYKSEYRFLYYVLFATALVLVIVDIIAALLIVRRAMKPNVSFIEAPEIINLLVCKPKAKNESNTSKRHLKCFKVFSIINQIIAVTIILVSVTAISFHTCGIILAIVANPVQVIASVAIYLLVVLCAVFACAFIYERTEEILVDNKYYGKAARIRLIFQIIVFACMIAFIVLFGYTYFSVILFIGDDNGLIVSFAKVFPIILLTIITWLMKKELQKYTRETNAETSMSVFPTRSEAYDVEESHTGAASLVGRRNIGSTYSNNDTLSLSSIPE